jgi:hypothetical protein
MLDTEGDNILAADSTMEFNTGQIVVDVMNLGSILPLPTFNLITGGKLELSGARLPKTGNFTGIGTFGTLDITPGMSTSTTTIDFSSNLTIENVITDEFINNVITLATGRTFTIKDKYNKEIDGGFCTPDNAGPTVTAIYPPNGADLDANVIFSIEDNRAGVDIDSLTYSIKGVGYSDTSSQTTWNESSGVYLVETNPDADFSKGEAVQVVINVCDKNTDPSVNCTN